MKKFKDPHNKHLRRYLLLSVIIFSLVGIGHLLLIINKFPIIIDGNQIPLIISCLAFFMSMMMVIMGTYYYKASYKK